MSRSPSSRITAHKLALLVHRYVGLAMAAFLITAGVTGSVIAFDSELDTLVNPDFFLVSPPANGQAPLDPFALNEIVQKQFPDERINSIGLRREPGGSATFWISDKEVFVNPYDGAILGSRTWGDITEGFHNIVTFLYRLHFSLALGDVGMFVFGCVSLLWTVDCFVGAYLTLPQSTARGGRRSVRTWFTSWLPMWLLKTKKLFTLIFTWHRASGLWVWLMLLVFAWSGVALNLGEVYEPVMNVMLGPEDEHEKLRKLDLPRINPKLSHREALEVGQRLIASEAKMRNFESIAEHSLAYAPDYGIYVLRFESNLDIAQRLANTNVVFDGDTGALVEFNATTGQNRASTFRAWIIALHFGEVRTLGLPYRIFVSMMGLTIAALSVTGVWIWWVKRKKRTA